MSFLVVLVLDDPDQCRDILDAWDKAGVKGVTITESTGLGRMMNKGFRDDLPLMPSLHNLFESVEMRHRTLFSVVDTLEVAHALVEATQKVTGDLNLHNTGLLFVVPVVEVYGLHREDG